MFYNHERKLVNQWVKGEPSFCPYCRNPMIAKMGRMVIWHWAHYADSGCGYTETLWHMVWKMVYLSVPGWEVEYPVEIDGKQYRLDAYNQRTGSVREFVHSISDTYRQKHLDLLASEYSPLWIWDGDAFRSKFLKWHRRDSDLWFSYGLKRSALWLFKELDSYLHFNGFWWRHWKDNKWFMIESEKTKFLLSQFNSIRKEYAKKRVFQKAVGHLPENPIDGGDIGVSKETVDLESDGQTARFDL